MTEIHTQVLKVVSPAPILLNYLSIYTNSHVSVVGAVGCNAKTTAYLTAAFHTAALHTAAFHTARWTDIVAQIHEAVFAS